MDIDPSYFPLIAAVIGIGGIAIGTLLSEIRTWLENRRSNKRILKTALYHQYELFGEMLAFDRDISDKFVESLRTKLLSLGVPQTPADEIFGSIPSNVIDLLQTSKEKSFREVVAKHEAIMIRLAEVDPLFASSWSYRSRSAFPEQLAIFLTAASSVSTEKNEITDNFIEHIRKWFEEKSQKRLLSSFEKGVVEIAWRIGFRTWWNVKRSITEWRKNMLDDINNETNEYILEIVKFGMENRELIQKQIQADDGANKT